MTVHVPLTISPESPTAFALECEGRKLIHFEDMGRRARLENDEAGKFARHDLLRWGAPFALAPQGLISLHASAVHKEEITVGFVGIGGAGKSTLAWELSRRGWEPVADDLMICDAGGRVNVLGERTLRQWCEDQAARLNWQELRIEHRRSKIEAREPRKQDSGSRTNSLSGSIDSRSRILDPGASIFGPLSSILDEEIWPWINYSELAQRLTDPGNQKWLSISGLCFLQETRGKNFTVNPLISGDHFRRLVQYGFGGLPTPAAWANQFQVYAAIAGRVPAATLQVPEGLDQMRSALPQWEDGLPQWLSEHTSVRT